MCELYIGHWISTNGSKYVNSNSIFGIYIHELVYSPVFKGFAHFLAELLTLKNLCYLCDL